jgi:hypothetical protein
MEQVVDAAQVLSMGVEWLVLRNMYAGFVSQAYYDPQFIY